MRRYDGLPATFGEDLTAVGFSFSLDRLEQIATPQLDVSDSQPADVNGDASGFEQALELRRAGKAVEAVLVVAIAKGRLLELSLELFSMAGIHFADNVRTSRKLIFDAEDGKHASFL